MGSETNLYQLPKGWVRTKVGDIFEFAYGKGLVKSARKETGPYPVYGSNGVVGFHDEYVTVGPKVIVGRKGAAGAVHYCNENCWPIDTTYFINSINVVDSKFSYYLLKNLRLNQFETSTAIPGLNRDDAYRLDILLPPLPEQKRIVAKIEELFSELDNGIAALKTVQEQLKVYRQAILKHAFEGKLTAKWREENADKLEPPEQLLTRIQQERDARYQQQLEEWKMAVKKWEVTGKEGKKPGKPKLPTKSRIIHNEYLPTLPEGWFWFELASIMETVQIGPFGSLLHKADYVTNAIPLINPSHIKNQKIVPDWNLTITEEKLSELTKYVMCESDIVIGRRGEMGRCAVVTPIESGWLCGTGSLFARPLDIANPKFYSLIISSQRVRDFLSNSSIGTTMQNLNEKILNGTPIPVCARAEQDEIISQLSSQYSVIEQMEKTIAQEIKRAQTLHQSILKKAFSGKLVQQDPNDESASELLARIKAYKEQKKQPAYRSETHRGRKKFSKRA